MSRPLISVRQLGKSYRLGDTLAHTTLRDQIAAGIGRLFHHRTESDDRELFWALQDISFDVVPGEVVGIIGRNGAGKSTLLKILSQVTAPSVGEVRVRGRLASLLEVGTGFHPELSGRENVFLNGAILGMTKVEIMRKFDEIVAFAGVETFLDTPVKRYSSGMYVRLAFAVAAHLDPEILIVDEVLAVGDASFQRKCLDKMQNVREEGRTVLFVSHNVSAITRLCPRAILLDAGRIIEDGPSQKVVTHYLGSGVGAMAERCWQVAAKAPADHVVRLRRVSIQNEQGEVTDVHDIRRPIGIEIEFDVIEEGHVLVPNCPLYNEEGICVFHLSDTDPAWRRRPRPRGTYVTTAWIPGNLLAEGTLFVGVAISTLDPVIVHLHEPSAVAFQVVDKMEGDSARGDYAGPFPGGGPTNGALDKPSANDQLSHRGPSTGSIPFVKVVILCGGLGTRLREETEFRPKPMVPIGERPILWHVMKTYAHYGHSDFILCLGYRGETIKDYFRNYQWNANNVTLHIGEKAKAIYHSQHNENWTVTLLDTGQQTQTGGRLRRALPYIDSDTFLFTYGDGLIDSDINRSIEYHGQHGCIATVTAVRPISRFGELGMMGDTVTAFREKPEKEDEFVSGGYFVMNKSIGQYLDGDETILESAPMERLAKEGQLKAYRHPGFWQCMDNYREMDLLNKMWLSGQAPWKVWPE